MSAPDSPHPDRASLQGFALGMLELHAFGIVERHLTTCATCCRALDTIPGDRLIELIRDCPHSKYRAGASALSAGYEVLEEIGRGGVGIVFKARQRGLGRIVALKRLRSGTFADRDDLARFHREAEALARLQHPNIVQVFEAGEQDGHPFLALEYVDGPSLRERLEQSPLAPGLAAQIVAILADAVEFAHRHNIVHRDLKPGNVLLAGLVHHARSNEVGLGDTPRSAGAVTRVLSDSAGVPKIADFGLAKLFDAESDQTRTGMLLGTPGYMAPEQSRGPASKVGPAADVYALGAILYEALTGRPPFRAASPLETIELVHASDPLPPRRLQPNVPRDLETICLKALRRDPLARYGTAAAMADDLRRFLAGKPILGRPVGPAEKLWKATRRHPARAALCGVVGLAAAAGAIGLVLHERRLEREAARASTIYRAGNESVRLAILKLEDPRWADAPHLDEFRKEEIRQFIPFFEAMLAATPGESEPERAARAEAHAGLGRLQYLLGEADKSLENWNEVIRLLRRRRDEWPRSTLGLELLSDAYTKLSFAALEASDSAEELRNCELAWEATGRLRNAHPESPLLDWRVAQCLQNLAYAHFAVGDLASSEREYREVLDLRLRISRGDPQNAEARLATADVYWALLNLVQDRPGEAARILGQVEALLEPLATPAGPLRASTGLGSFYTRWGSLLATTDESGALRAYARAANLLEQVREREPRLPLLRQITFDLHFARARLLTDQARYSEAIDEWDRACEFATRAADERFCRGQLMGALIGGRRLDRALAEAEALLNDPALEAATAHSSAYAILGIDVLLKHNEAADRAIEERARTLAVGFLQRAAAGGHFRDAEQRRQLLEAPQLAPLRERDEFRQLLRELDAGP